MNAVDQVRDDLEKAASMVSTARRLLAAGTTVDLSVLEAKIRSACGVLMELERERGRALVPVMEALISDLDRLSEAIRERRDPLAERLGPQRVG